MRVGKLQHHQGKLSQALDTLKQVSQPLGRQQGGPHCSLTYTEDAGRIALLSTPELLPIRSDRRPLALVLVILTALLRIFSTLFCL